MTRIGTFFRWTGTYSGRCTCRRGRGRSTSSWLLYIRYAGRAASLPPPSSSFSHPGRGNAIMRAVDGTAIVLCNGYYGTINGKTAHGLVRGTDRYRILAVVDPPTAGRDAGEVLDGVHRGIPVVASIGEALGDPKTKFDFAIVGIATPGGRMTADLRASLREVLENGLSVVNGLHEFAGDDPELAGLARKNGLAITDVRRVKPSGELHFWTGEIRSLATPRVAVLG